jgi:CheY-like chemotaxis protein
MPDKKTIPAVLYIEDDDISKEVVIMFLKDSFAVDTASDSNEAVKKLGSKKYAAVLMDINLGKGLSGLDLVKGIKKMQGYNNIPIIAVTAYALREDENKILAGGCTHYIAKPFTKKSLVETLLKAIGK